MPYPRSPRRPLAPALPCLRTLAGLLLLGLLTACPSQPAPDTTPDPFAFTPVTGADTVTFYASAPVTITGLTAPAPVSVVGGSYSVDDGPFTAAPGTVRGGQAVRVGVLSSADPSGAAEATLTIGGVSAAFRVTTSGEAAETLTLWFDGSLVGHQGEAPTAAEGIAFQPGVSGGAAYFPAGSRLVYPAAGNIDAREGVLELWLRPGWDGNDGKDHYILGWGTWGGLLVGKDAANNLRLILNRYGAGGAPEVGTSVNVAGWRAGEWRRLRFAWSSRAGRAEIFVDGRLAAGASFAGPLPQIASPEFYVGSDGGNSPLEGAVDSLRVKVPTGAAAPPSAPSVVLDPGEFEAPLGQPRILTASATGAADPQLEWLLRRYGPNGEPWPCDPCPATLEAEGGRATFRSGAPGIFLVVARLKADPARQARAVVWATAKAPSVDPVHPLLEVAAPGALWEVPVAVINYLPTDDGVNLDADLTAWSATLAQMHARLERMNIQLKFMREEASRFRGYRDPAAVPALGYRVVKVLTFYEPMPLGNAVPWKPGEGVYFPDYNQILRRAGGRELIEGLGVKEVWVWGWHHGSIEPVESNMSSPLTGDVSNSSRFPDDLPVYAHTYTLYNFNFTRQVNLHTLGHQLEALFTHVAQQQDGNADLFWGRFVGRNSDGSFQQGRCGDTHFPPNAAHGYDYFNPAPVQSDCEDWTPAGTGARKPVSADTWHGLAYAWPGSEPPPGHPDSVIDADARYYLWWMQNMPGRGNAVPYGGSTMENWWRFVGDWDGSVRAGAGLHR